MHFLYRLYLEVVLHTELLHEHCYLFEIMLRLVNMSEVVTHHFSMRNQLTPAARPLAPFSLHFLNGLSLKFSFLPLNGPCLCLLPLQVNRCEEITIFIFVTVFIVIIVLEGRRDMLLVCVYLRYRHAGNDHNSIGEEAGVFVAGEEHF